MPDDNSKCRQVGRKVHTNLAFSPPPPHVHASNVRENAVTLMRYPAAAPTMLLPQLIVCI